MGLGISRAIAFQEGWSPVLQKFVHSAAKKTGTFHLRVAIDTRTA